MSATEGNGTLTPRPTSYTDQTISPAPQLPADAPSNHQARLTFPEDLEAATAQLAMAVNATTASPISSTAVVRVSPPTRNPIQAAKASVMNPARTAQKRNNPPSLARGRIGVSAKANDSAIKSP